MIYEFNDEEREKLQRRMEEDNQRELDGLLYLAKNQGKEEGRIEGLEEGYLSGKEEGQYQIAKRCKELGSSIEFIMKATGLSKEIIEKL